MRQKIPEKIQKLQEIYSPYMKFVKGNGMVMVSDAPKEAIEAKEQADKWFYEHNRDRY